MQKVNEPSPKKLRQSRSKITLGTPSVAPNCQKGLSFEYEDYWGRDEIDLE